MTSKLLVAGLTGAVVQMAALPGPARAEFSASVEDRQRCFAVERTEGHVTYATMRLMARQTCEVGFRGRASMRVDQRPSGHLFVIQNGSFQNGFMYTPTSNGGRDSFTISGQRSSGLLSFAMRPFTLVVTVEVTPRETTRGAAPAPARNAARAPAARPSEPPPSWVTGPTQ